MPTHKLGCIWHFHYKSAVLSHFILICSLGVLGGVRPTCEWQVKFTANSNCQGCSTAAWQVKVENLWPGPTSFFFRWVKVFTAALHKKGSRKRCHGPESAPRATEGQRQSKMLKVTQLLSSRPGTLMLVFRALNFVGFATAHSFQCHRGQRNLKNSIWCLQALLQQYSKALGNSTPIVQSLGLLTSGTNMESCTIPILWISKHFQHMT